MPAVTIMQLGRPSETVDVEECTTYAEAFAQAGLPAPRAGQLTIDGADAVAPTDRIRDHVRVFYSANVKGA